MNHTTFAEMDEEDILHFKWRPVHSAIIKDLRKKHRITQSKLAKEIGTYTMKIQRFESGQYRLTGDDVKKLSKYFDVPEDNFFPRP